MKTLNLILIFALFFFVQKNALSQDTIRWDLQKCIDYALEHNIQIKQTKLQAEVSESSLQQSKAGLLPDINASASDAFQFGRTIDPYTNSFTENNIQSVSMSINSSITLFNGLQQYNTVKQSNYTLLSDLEQVNEIKNSVSMQVATAYLQILLDMELLEVAKSQLTISQEQVNRTKILVEAGSLAKGNLLEIQAQLAGEELNKVNAENNLKTSYLNLAQLLELDTAAVLRIQVPQIDEPSEGVLLDSVSSIYDKSQDLPRIKRQEYKLESSEQSLKVSKGGLSPRLYLSASYGTGYSSARERYTREPGDPMEVGYVGSSGETVLAPSFNTLTHPYHFGDQIVDNRSFSFVIGIQIPLFNNFLTKHRITQSKLQVENSKYELELAKNQLLKDIQTASNSAEASLARYDASKKAVEAQEESFSYMQQKFDLGLVNSVDYNTAKNQLTKSQSDMVQAKFEFLFRINILNFYQGIPFKL